MLRDLAQPSHLLILAVLVAVLFGWKKLPDVTRSVGRSMRIFKTEMGEMKSDGKESTPSAAASDTVKSTAATPTAAPVVPPVQVQPPVQPVQTPVSTPAAPSVQDHAVNPTAAPHDISR